MSKYDEKEYRLGEYWLGRREGSPAYYRYWLDGRVVRRASLGTTELEDAKRKLEEWFIKTREVQDEQPSSASLAASAHAAHGALANPPAPGPRPPHNR